jgi:glycosyltransferase involved in cell wall biosynthesis
VDHLGAKLLIYQVSDKYDANEDSALSRNIIRKMDQQLKRQASVVMYSGRKLFEEATEPHRYFLEQAVDFEHFAEAASRTAPDIASIPRPVLGYLGYIDFMMNIALIEEVAGLRPEWHWVFVGGKSNLVQISAPNVHFLGAKPYSKIPEYVNHFDVCVLPWTLEKAFTSYGSAIKVKEYLATGKPVVISPLYEYVDVPGIRVYKTAPEFMAVVEDALHNDGARERKLRQAAVRDCTWDVRTRQVAELITSLLANGSFVAANAPASAVTAADGRELRRETA